MNLKEIKDLFGVDLTLKNRKPHYVYLRGIYMDQEKAKGRRTLKICQELQCNHATGFHYFKRKEMYKSIPEYNEMKIVFDTGNVELFKEVDYRLRNKKYIHYDNFDKKPKKVAEEVPVVRWHSSRIIEALRNDNNNKLWDKPMPDFDNNDYKILERLENGK